MIFDIKDLNARHRELSFKKYDLLANYEKAIQTIEVKKSLEKEPHEAYSPRKTRTGYSEKEEKNIKIESKLKAYSAENIKKESDTISHNIFGVNEMRYMLNKETNEMLDAYTQLSSDYNEFYKDRFKKDPSRALKAISISDRQIEAIRSELKNAAQKIQDPKRNPEQNLYAALNEVDKRMSLLIIRIQDQTENINNKGKTSITDSIRKKLEEEKETLLLQYERLQSSCTAVPLKQKAIDHITRKKQELENALEILDQSISTSILQHESPSNENKDSRKGHLVDPHDLIDPHKIKKDNWVQEKNKVFRQYCNLLSRYRKLQNAMEQNNTKSLNTFREGAIDIQKDNLKLQNAYREFQTYSDFQNKYETNQKYKNTGEELASKQISILQKKDKDISMEVQKFLENKQKELMDKTSMGSPKPNQLLPSYATAKLAGNWTNNPAVTFTAPKTNANASTPGAPPIPPPRQRQNLIIAFPLVFSTALKAASLSNSSVVPTMLFKMNSPAGYSEPYRDPTL